jgi:hypothetical protein
MGAYQRYPSGSRGEAGAYQKCKRYGDPFLPTKGAPESLFALATFVVIFFNKGGRHDRCENYLGSGG